jgi:hypothetical protein
VQEVFRPRRQCESERERPGGLSGGGDTLYGVGQFVDRSAPITRRILDGAADEAGSGGEPDGFRNRFRRVGEAVLEIRGDRQMRRFHDGSGIGHGLVAGDRSLAVPPAEREGKTRARRRQRLEPKRREDASRPRIPGVWNDECAGPLVQSTESARLLALTDAHVRPLDRGPWMLVALLRCRSLIGPTMKACRSHLPNRVPGLE